MNSKKFMICAFFRVYTQFYMFIIVSGAKRYKNLLKMSAGLHKKMVGAIILAGGKGKRIDGEKPFIKLNGKYLICYALNIIKKISDEIIIVTSKEKLNYLKKLVDSSIKIVVDISPEKGPLMAFFSGLKHINSEFVVVLPCDSPFINEKLLRFLVSKAENVDAVVPLWPNENIEPLHSVYNVASTLKASETAIMEKTFKISDMINKLKNTNYVPVKKLREYDPDLLTFFNINNQEDLNEAEAIIKRNINK